MTKENITKKQSKQPKTKQRVARKYKGLFINNIDQLLYKDFVDLAKNKNIHQKQLFTEVFTHYLNFPFKLDTEENATIQEARRVASNAFSSGTKKAIMRYAKSIIKLKDKPEPPVNMKIKNSSKAATARVEVLIQKMISSNDNTANWYDKVLLTKSSILDYAEKQKALDPDSISLGKVVLDRYIEQNKELIKSHNEKHNLSPNHNSLAYYERLKIAKGESL